MFFSPFLPAWKTEPCPKKASQLFVQEICCQNEDSPSLTLTIKVTDDLEEQDSAHFFFYKQDHVNWAAPVKINIKVNDPQFSHSDVDIVLQSVKDGAVIFSLQ